MHLTKTATQFFQVIHHVMERRRMRYTSITLMILALSSGCATRRPVTFADGDDLLKAASHIKIGDTRNEVVCYLGWRTDQGQVGPAYFSPDDGGGMIFPWLAFWHWRVDTVDLNVDFTDDARVYRIHYNDDRKTLGRHMMIGPNNAMPTARKSASRRPADSAR